jgi:hypothetical protein
VLGRIAVGGVVDDAGVDDPNDATHMDSGTIAGSNGDAGSWCGNVEDLAPEEDPGTWPANGDSRMTGPRNVSYATAGSSPRSTSSPEVEGVGGVDRIGSTYFSTPESTSCSTPGCTTSSMTLFSLGSALFPAELFCSGYLKQRGISRHRKNMRITIGFIY